MSHDIDSDRPSGTSPPTESHGESEDVDGDSQENSWSVAVLDENEIRGEITAEWLREGIQCELATTPTELHRYLGRECQAVCIRHDGDRYDGIVKKIWNVYPHVQILLLLSRNEFRTVDRTCDEQLQEPYSKSELQNTVRQLVGRGLYALKLREYYQLTSYLATKRTAETDDGASIDDLEEKLEAVKSDIDVITSAFGNADFQAVLRSHQKREQALGTPNMDAEEETPSKYRPNRCPNCHLSWGADHSGRLDDGYERVAALVWRCRGCGTVRRVSQGEYDKIL